jgi:hypothetical protein
VVAHLERLAGHARGSWRLAARGLARERARTGAVVSAVAVATGQFEAVKGQKFTAGRMGEYTIEKDPTRDSGLRIVMGPFTVYTEDNIDE